MKVKKNINIFFVFCILFCSLGQGAETAYAQMKSTVKRGDSYFNNNEYIKAIPLYKRASKKNDEALRKLADCYRIIKNYKQAEIYYAKLVSKKPSDPMAYYYYGEVLLNNNKLEEAKSEFAIYSTLNSDDIRGDLYAKACDKLKELLIQPAHYSVYNLGEINSAGSDFCPAFYKDGLVFSSERLHDLVNYSKSGWTGNPYLTLYYSKGEKQKDSVYYEEARLFSKKFSGGGYCGPACFNADFTEIFFTKVDNTVTQKRGVVRQSKLYWSKYKNGWRTPVPLPFNSDDYSTGHPSVSKDGQYLYFSSNMPGGQGGTDIWVSKRDGDTWGSPENLGKEINTSGDESFPYISTNNTLYFSSTGHTGFGGMDIFSSLMKDSKWSSPRNLMPPINSSDDDFGIIFKDENNGYFSSNRAGGKGSDDLYGFAPSGAFTSLSGKILLSKNSTDGAPNVTVFLLSDKGTVLQTTTTDASGFFHFENLPSEQSYMVKIDEHDPNLINQKKFYLCDRQNKIVRVVVKSKDGFFVFENLPSDLTKLSELVEEDPSLKNISIAGNLYSGEERSPIENTKVNLLNDKGEVVQSTTTNAFGSFVFVNIDPDQNFTIAMDAVDPKIASSRIYFTNKSGKEIGMGKGGLFRFQILASDKNTIELLKVEDSQLLVDFNGVLYSDKERKNRLANSSISLVDKDGNVVSVSKTDMMGGFKFVDLPADQHYFVRLKEDDPSLEMKDVFLADTKGNIVATLKYKLGKFFRFELLPMEERSLSTIYFDDPWLKVAKMKADSKKENLMTIIENVYYDYGKWELLPQAVITLNKVINVMKENPDVTIDVVAHTDSRGNADFNLELSQKRAQAAVDYIVSKGINRKRLVAIGKGETELVNHCKDGVPCSEEEHAQNRRTEFKVKKTGI